jgi:hypothetical protein
MITAIYWVIVLFLLALTLTVLFREKRPTYQFNAVMLVVVLLIRLLGWK